MRPVRESEAAGRSRWRWTCNGCWPVLRRWSAGRGEADPEQRGRQLRALSGSGRCGYEHASRAALFQMLGVFAEFERSMIADRVRSGLAKAEGRKSGTPIGPAPDTRSWPV